MAYKITPNYFSIKYFDEELDSSIKLHSISYDKCNFRCGFCNFSNRHKDEYENFDTDVFEQIIKKLMLHSKYFKFTGGEPTLNPYLERDLRIVKRHGGCVFLDSNGSNPYIIKKLLDENLIDVLGVSLKGLSEDEALLNASINNSLLCWGNVFDTLSIASDSGTKVIVTMVLYEGIDFKSIDNFADTIKKYSNIHLKINNLIEVEFQGKKTFRRLEEKEIQDYIVEFLNKNVDWRGRVTLVKNNESTTDSNEVVFL